MTTFTDKTDGLDDVLAAYINALQDAVAALESGWMAAGETWTYASATTFTVSGDVTEKYPVGTKLKLTQSTVKYFYVVAAAYTSSTLITVTGGADYSLANAAITGNYLSHANTPQGFPQWMNWTPTVVGFSSSPTANYRFTIHGRMVTCVVKQIAAASNATTLTITAPVTPATLTSGTWRAFSQSYDNGAFLTAPGHVYLNTADPVIYCYTNCNDGAWTNSGNKRVGFTLIYPI